MKIQQAVIFSFLLLIIVGVMLPSDGNHGLLAPKSLAFLNAFFFLGIYYFSRWRVNLAQAWASLLFLLSLFFFSMWFIFGINQNPQMPSVQFDQFKVFLTTLFVPFGAWYLIQAKLLTPPKIFRTVIFANFAYSMTKILLMTFHLLGLINVWTILHLSGLRYMSMNILGNLGRIQTSVDIITPFLVYFVLQSESLGLNLSKRFRWIYLGAAGFSVFLSFSRLLIFAYIASVLLYALTLKVRSQLKLLTFGALLLLGGGSLLGPDRIEAIIERRLFSQDNYRSDATRERQTEALLNACDENPFLGKGLGGYTEACIRDRTLPYAYEVQWISFLMQFGIIGTCALFIPLIALMWNFIRLPLTMTKMGYVLLFLLWLLAGFTNPFLISLTSGIIYMLFLLASVMRTTSRA